jgi:hypothetical protein
MPNLSRSVAAFAFSVVAVAACSATPAGGGTEADTEVGSSSEDGAPGGDTVGGDTQSTDTANDDATVETSTDDGADNGGDSSGSDEGGGGWDPTAIPTSTGVCPEMAEGWNTFCPTGIDVCREAYVVRGSGTGGPLNLYWHGLYENAVDVQSFGAGGAVADMTRAQNGLAFFPEADPEALNRPGLPYPWWLLGSYMTQRKDDYYFMDEMIACAVEAGLVDADRINVGGMSSGGILTSHLVARRGYWASAVSWSGGWTVPFEISAPTPTMVLHGGPGDCAVGYCGFMNASEFFAEQLVDLGAFAFLCDHSEGDTSNNHHTDAMGETGAEFMSLAVRGQVHPWERYPFGGNGGNYLLDNFCYLPGEPSPWAPWD